jgi:hypothetical protein
VPAATTGQTSSVPGRRARVRLAVAAVVAVAVTIVAWEFAGIVDRVGRIPTRVEAARLGHVHVGDSTDRVQAALGPPELTSDVYRSAPYLLQCWYYDLHRPVHAEVCFDHWRVYHTERYR